NCDVSWAGSLSSATFDDPLIEAWQMLARIKLFDKSFLCQLLQRRGIIKLPRIDALGLGIARGDVFKDGFHLGLRDGGNIANVAEDVALERAREQLGVVGARVIAENANGEIRVALGVLDAFERGLEKTIHGLRPAAQEGIRGQQ